MFLPSNKFSITFIWLVIMIFESNRSLSIKVVQTFSPIQILFQPEGKTSIVSRAFEKDWKLKTKFTNWCWHWCKLLWRHWWERQLSEILSKYRFDVAQISHLHFPDIDRQIQHAWKYSQFTLKGKLSAINMMLPHTTRESKRG